MSEANQPKKLVQPKFSNACPSSGRVAHINMKAGQPVRDPAQVVALLKNVDISRGSFLMRVARRRASEANIDADDLLQESLLRAMTTRNCPAHVGINQFVMGVMRSLAGEIAGKRDREKIELNNVEVRIGDHLNIIVPSPADELERRALASAGEARLALIIGGNPAVEKVVDGRGMGLRGARLATFADLTPGQLASVNRLIRRRVAKAVSSTSMRSSATMK